MTKVVFACKSNSCRSQMAEGWAKRWIQDRKASASASASTVSMEERALLEDIVVASVALDSASVFGAAASLSSCSETTCCGDRCETVAERKLVKSMAVQAMSLDGVDISTHIPKTVEELAASLASSSSSTNKTRAFLRKQEPPSFQQQQHEPEDSQHGDMMMMDKLIVLCSCGDEMKSQLVRRSVSVEEWNVDAPTAAAQSGEGASAYRRVSQDIRLKVDNLMEQIVHEKKQQQQHRQQQHELRLEREREQQQAHIGMEDVLTSEAASALLSGKEIAGN
eukprot:scaffold6436_cov52-Attheya_sp.AAC.5